MSRKDIPIKLGLKLPDIVDFRTIPLRALLKLRALPPLEDEWSVDAEVGGIADNFMYGNNQYGCCVKSAFAHDILRLEKWEQGIQIEIGAQEVIDEYLRESGGVDNGLFLTYAMKDWRNHGLQFGDKLYKIHAFAGFEPRDHIAAMYSIMLLKGIIFGMQVYDKDVEQFHNDEAWHLTGENGSFRGGHGVYAYHYRKVPVLGFSGASEAILRGQGHGHIELSNAPRVLSWSDAGVTCMTWGERQFMTWDFWDARVTQCFAVIDAITSGEVKRVLDIKLLEQQLQEITGNKPETGGGCSIAPISWLKRLR